MECLVRKFFVEEWSMKPFETKYEKEVASRDPKDYIIPDKVHEFSFFEVLELTLFDPSSNQNVKLKSGKINYSPIYIPGGQVFTQEDIIMGRYPLGWSKDRSEVDRAREIKNLLHELDECKSDKIVRNRWTHETPLSILDKEGRGVICL